MLEHWIQPQRGPAFQKEYLSDDRIGSNLSEMADHHTKAGSREVALIGADMRWANLVRRHLYQYTYRMPDIRVYDLGDLRRLEPDFVIGPLVELLSSRICPILIGANLGLIKAFRQSLLHTQNTFRPAVIHESIPESLITTSEKTIVIGVQQHLIPRRVPEHIHALHLSDTRNAMSDAETLIRDSNGIVFDLTAMSHIDMPSQKSSSTSGFCTEEACMLMRFAGLHSDTKAVILSGHDPMSLQLDISANTTAQLIWYFLEAFSQCIVEDPLHSPHYTSYTVHLDQYDAGFKFYKSERTGRWWVQIHSGNSEPLFPCTYRDYHSATNGLISDRLIACTNASLESSKQTL